MAAGLATLEILAEPDAYEMLESQSERLASGLLAAAEDHNVAVAINRVGSMIGLYFVRERGQRVTNFAEACASDTTRFATFFHAMLDRGVYLAPSQYEALFVGLAHDDSAIDQTVEAADESFAIVGASKIT